MRVVDPVEHWRFALGFLLAPALPCLIIAAHYTQGGLGEALAVFTALMVSSLVMSLLVGMPLYFLISRFVHVGLELCLACGGSISLLMCALVFFGRAGAEVPNTVLLLIGKGHYGLHDFSNVLRGCANLMLLGLGSGFCFWVLALRGRRRA